MARFPGHSPSSARRGAARPWICLLLLGLVGCTEGPSRLAGGASETEATLTGRIRLPDGTPVADIAVRLRPAHFLRDTARAGLAGDSAGGIADGRTDAQGFFRFDSVFLGDYSIEALDGDSRGVHLRASVTGGGKRFETDDGVLQPLSVIRGRITLPAGASPPGTSGGSFVQVYGLDRAVRADSAGAFELGGMPGGLYSLRVTPASDSVSAKTIFGVNLLPGSVENLGDVALAPALDAEDYSLWKDSARVVVNTAAAGVTDGVSSFPLLLRLDRSNFDFTRTTGLDLRFATVSGRHLPYEIERWAPLEGKAEIWIRADTLLGKDSVQFLKMYWNRPGAGGRSDGSAVFDTGAGYQGVWHLDRDPAEPEAGFRDASGQGNHARGERLDSAGQSSGAIHLAQDLDGQTQSIQTSKAFEGPQEFTLSLWFRTLTTAGGRLAGFGSHQQGASRYFDRHVWMDNQGLIHFGVFPGPDTAVDPGIRRILSSSRACNDGAWHHVAARLSQAGQFLFLDGVPIASDVSTRNASHYPGFWRFGYDNLVTWEHRPSSDRFRGVLDEIRVTRRPASDAWLRLAFETQKPGSTVVAILP